MEEEMESNEEQRYIGGTRVLLVKHYDGQTMPPLREQEVSPKRCLLKRRVSLVITPPPPLPPPPLPPSPPPTTSQISTFGVIGGVAAAAVGLWLYTKTSNSGADIQGF